MHMSHESLPRQPEIAKVSTELFMSAADHIHLRDEIVEAARELVLFQTPNSFDSELADIPLRGGMPLGFSALGDMFNRMNFSTRKELSNDPNEAKDASVKLWLMGSHRDEQLKFVSEDTPVKFGRNKMFNIFPWPFDAIEPIDEIECADLEYSLDSLIPATRFSALADPRRDDAFDVIALTTADLLRQYTDEPKQNTLRTYLSKDYVVSRIGTVNYFGETGNRLVIEQTGNKSTLSLTSMAKIDLGKDTEVFEHLGYSFKPNDRNPMSGHVRLTLLSHDLPRDVLNEYLNSTQGNISVSHIGERALASLLNELHNS